MASIKPRIIIHGGAGNITRQNLPRQEWEKYRSALLNIIHAAEAYIELGKATALDASVYAVSLLENNPLFNSGRGAVFNREGRVELEASVMVSSGKNKRASAVSLIKHVKNPIRLAAEILKRGDDEDSGGAQSHIHLSGSQAEELAMKYGLDIVPEAYFWTRKRWDEHRRGLQKHSLDSLDSSPAPDGHEWYADEDGWNGRDYLPQGTVGAVVLDAEGVVAVATSTGGLTNKLPGRIGDTPTVAAGFWAEEWIEQTSNPLTMSQLPTMSSLSSLLGACLSPWSSSDEIFSTRPARHAVACGGTGNGDSFIRLAACRTAVARSRFTGCSLAFSIHTMAGKGGELQQSAGSRWAKTGEGQGGIIGIELVGTDSRICFDFNCAMFRAWIDDKGFPRCMVFEDEY